MGSIVCMLTAISCKPVMWSETAVLGQDWSQTPKIGLCLGLAGLVLCCETWCCYTRPHNVLEGHSNFSNSFSILCLKHH